MQTLTLKVKNDSDISLLMHLAERLGISIINKPKTSAKTSDNKDLFLLLHNLRKENDLFEEIKNPAVWQREIRKDRDIPNRV